MRRGRVSASLARGIDDLARSIEAEVRCKVAGTRAGSRVVVVPVVVLRVFEEMQE